MAMKLEALAGTANEIRRDVIKSITAAKSGHPGGSLSAVDILTALYFSEMRIDPANPQDEDRDRLVLSKGHVAPALYVVLARRGYFSPELLTSLRKFGSVLQGYPDMTHVPGVDMSTGSLGQGLSAANGMALAGKLDGRDYRVYVVCGDGELQEGQIWEAAMTAAHYKLDNLVAFVDHNGLQIDGTNDEVMSLRDIAAKFRSFGWHTEKINGHSYEDIQAALHRARLCKGRPSVIVAETIKGRGVDFMENQVGWHGKAPNKEQAEAAIRELQDTAEGEVEA